MYLTTAYDTFSEKKSFNHWQFARGIEVHPVIGGGNLSSRTEDAAVARLSNTGAQCFFTKVAEDKAYKDNAATNRRL
jgi:hypothetical protein